MSLVQCLRQAAPTQRGVIHVDVVVLRTRRRRSGRPRGCYGRGLSNTECHPPCIPIGKTCTYGKQLVPSSCGEKFRDAVRAHVSEVEHTHHRQFPQAKGRVERNHGTHQDRLIKKMRRKAIASYEAANQFLENEYLPKHNRRFARPIGQARGLSRAETNGPRTA